MFPEDFEIDKDRLIRMWIAEGFIQCEKQGKSLFELGESYLHELINKSMIQPIHNLFTGMLHSCRIHDMVLDLIRSLSSEENFITVLNDMDSTSPSNTIRRLSLQFGKKSHMMVQVTRNLLQHARSVVIFPSAVAQVPAAGSCRVLRVLDLEHCNLSQNKSLKDLGKLYHLRYLGLRGTSVSHLPEEIGNLQFLQTLDVRSNTISSLPWSVVQLRNLICLDIDVSTRVPNGIGNLRCLEQLSRLCIDESTINIIEELGHLTELRRLWIKLEKWNEKLLECLHKLQKIQELHVVVPPGQRSIGGLDDWVAPRHLRLLGTEDSYWFSTLPAWVNPLLVPDLTCLYITVRELQQVDLEILGRLPALRSLELEVDHVNLGILGRFVVSAGLFPCLVHCKFWGFVEPVVFRQGAMPRIRELYLDLFFMWEAGETISSDGGLVMGMENLPLLQDVFIEFRSEVASTEEVDQAKATLRRAAEIHPNHPRLTIYSD